jgi:putative glutamine amidotransferase
VIPVVGVTCGSGGENGPMSLDMDYTRAISDAGGLPLAIPPDLPGESLAPLLEILDGLLLSGGPDVDPVHFGEEPLPAMGRIDLGRDRVELGLARLALEIGMPILGICRGAQVLNIAAGGDIFQDLPSQVEGILKHAQQPTPMPHPTHGIRIEPGSLLASVTGRGSLRVNTWHHQAVRRVAPGFAVSATAEDGVIEAIEKTGAAFVLGLQFHPESMAKGGSPEATLLFEAFVRACREKARP